LELGEDDLRDALRVQDAEGVLEHPIERANEIRPARLAGVDLVADVEARRLAAHERAVHVEEGRTARVAHPRKPSPTATERRCSPNATIQPSTLSAPFTSRGSWQKIIGL